MKKKKLISLVLAGTMVFGLAACGSNGGDKKSEGNSDSDKVVKVAVVETAYGADMWNDVAAAFEKETGVKVELTIDKNIEDIIQPQMKSGEYPDVIMRAVGSESAITETFIKDNNVEELTDVLDMTVPGEDAKVGDKILPGFTENSIVNPYGDGKTYLMPMFYSPCGLFYDANLFKTKGWDVPETWDDMWALADKAKAEGIWDTDGAKKAFDIVTQLASHVEPTTTANANDNDFRNNQQLVLDDKALFMPNGNWVIGEMADAPRADGFDWGFTALPAVEKDGERASYTFFEQIWMPSGAENKDLGKEFIAYMYSDAAAEIFAKSGAIQPIEGMSDKLDGDNKLYYSIYDTGAVAVMDAFATTDPVEGVTVRTTFFDPVNSLVTGDKTEDDWVNQIKTDSDKLRAALK